MVNNTNNTDLTEIDFDNLITLDNEVNDKVPSLTAEEKLEEIKSASTTHMGLLNALVEINKTADVLKKIDNEETIADRNKVLNVIFEGYAQKRYMTNLKIEELKLDLVKSVMENVDSLDLETRINTIEKLHNMTTLDAQKALSTVSRGSNEPSGPSNVPGVNITLNNASGNGTVESTVNNNTLNVDSGITVDQMKEVASLNSTLKSWKETGAPRKIVPSEAEEK